VALKKIIVIDGKWDTQTPAIQYALKASKGTDTEIVGIFPAGDSGKGTIEKAEAALKTVKQKMASEGVAFSSYVVAQDAQAFMKRINDLMPASLVIIGDVKFSADMVKGGVSAEALREKLACPVTTAENIPAAGRAEEKPAKGTNWGMWIVYAIGSAFMYVVFYPKIGALNEKVFMSGTVIGAIATMAVVIVHAWVWGNTTHILPKLFKLEK
jgi:hypothetical protein